MITPPTYGIYKVTAHVNDVGVVSCDLELEGKDGVDRFELRVDRVRIREAPYYVPLLTLPGTRQMKELIDADPSIKLIFFCSPGNPTGTLIPLESIHT
jgi:histidinol-phosphate aminotransferase